MNTRNRVALPGLTAFVIVCSLASCDHSSTPSGVGDRKAGLWSTEAQGQKIFHTGVDNQVQKIIEGSSSRRCEPGRSYGDDGAIANPAMIRRVIDVPEHRMTIVVEVPKDAGLGAGTFLLSVRRHPSDAEMTEELIMASPSKAQSGVALDTSARSWSFTRIGDCPQGMKPFEKLPAP